MRCHVGGSAGSTRETRAVCRIDAEIYSRDRCRDSKSGGVRTLVYIDWQTRLSKGITTCGSHFCTGYKAIRQNVCWLRQVLPVLRCCVGRGRSGSYVKDGMHGSG